MIAVAIAGVVLLTTICLTISWWVAGRAHSGRHHVGGWLVLGVSLVAWLLALLLGLPAAPGWSLAGLLAATLLGTRLGLRLGSDGALLAFLITASVVDVLSFFSGPTRLLLDASDPDSHRRLLFLVAHLPWQGGVLPLLGIADGFGLGVIASSLASRGNGLGWILLASGVPMLVAVVVGLAFGGAPAYPFLALGVGLLLRWHRVDRS